MYKKIAFTVILGIIISISVTSTSFAKRNKSEKEIEVKTVEKIVEKKVFVDKIINEGCLVGDCKDQVSVYKSEDRIFIGKWANGQPTYGAFYNPQQQKIIISGTGDQGIIDFFDNSISKQPIKSLLYNNPKDNRYIYNTKQISFFQTIGSCLDYFISDIMPKIITCIGIILVGILLLICLGASLNGKKQIGMWILLSWLYILCLKTLSIFYFLLKGIYKATGWLIKLFHNHFLFINMKLITWKTEFNAKEQNPFINVQESDGQIPWRFR